MIDCVAKALEPLAWAAIGVHDTQKAWLRRKSSLDKARAAIEAMSEPTVNMIVAGASIIMEKRFNPISAIDISPETWRAMIDAAISIEE